MYSFPPQGWKIHITSTIYDAQNVLYDVAEYLFVKSISFKYLSSRTCFIQANGKYADRLESGKFITIYPSSEHIFIQLLKDLKTIVCKYDDGPYILTDKQWQNSNVFFRYGALKPRFSNEKNVPVIVTPQGDLIPDKELPLYSLPSFVDEPIYVKENNYLRKIKLIDFEAAKKLSQDFQVDIATPGFTNDAVCNYEQQDWYAFAVIVHRLFVPICPLYYLAPSLLFCQDYMVQKHFGNEAVSFLRSVRSRMLGLTPLLSHGPFIDKALQACDKLLDPENIETFMRLLYKGIVSGLDLRGEYPVKGDISMYGDEMSKYSIGSGFAGVSLALLKSSCLENSEWFYAIAREKYISVLRKLKDGMSFRAGLFNGTVGVAMAAYEVFSREECHKMLSYIGISHIDYLAGIDDYSLYSGLSGIGMALLSLGASRNSHEEKMLSYILSKVYERCDCGLTSQDMLSSKADFTLMKGWLGAGLFLWKASLCRKDDALRSRAESIFRLTLTHLANADNKERPMYYVDHLKNKPRTMPYLDCGTSGVALAFIEVYKDGNESMEFLNEEFLRRLSQGSDMVCTFNGGLFGGYVGLLPAAIALRDLGIDDELWERIIDGLNLYLMKNNGNIVFPGLYGYKCSMDLGTGSAGVLLALSDSGRSGEWGSWMPVLENEDFSLFRV